MEMMFYICAAIGGTLIVCQFLMTLFGLGAEHDLAGGDDVDVGGTDAGGDHHVGHGNESTWFLGVLTFRTVSAGLAFFGLVGIIGIQSELHDAVTLALAIGAGLIAVFLVAWIMRMMVKLNADGTVRIDKAVGCQGTVYLPVPGAHGGAGKVQVSVLNRTLEYKAVSKTHDLPVGMKIVVVNVIGSDTVEVEPAQAE